jgi:hypothetical protein
MTDHAFSALERELFELAPHVDFPPTPDVYAAIAGRLHDREPARRRTGWWLVSRPVAAIAAALAAVLAVVLVVSPGAREAVASIFRGVPGIRVLIPDEKNAPSKPASPVPAGTGVAPISPTSSPSFTPAAAEPVIPGTPTTLARVAGKVPFTLRVPTALGRPHRVYLEPRAARGTVTMVWQERPDLPRAAGSVGAVLTEFKPAEGGNFAYWRKSPTGGVPSTFRDLPVNGGDGGWIEGGHRLDFAIPDSTDWSETATSRIAANTLIWNQDGITFRLETALPLEKALAIAASIR